MKNVTSQNVEFDDQVTFEIGFFQEGFTPTALNTMQWASRWTAVDRTTYNPEENFFASTVTFANNDLPFTEGRLAYMWGSTGGARPEWLLVTSNDWLWPTAALGLPPIWQIGSATKVILGTINPSGSPFLMRTASVANPLGGSLTPEQWLAQHFTVAERADSAIGGFEADPDDDGFDNLLEMALGLNPKVSEKGDQLPYKIDFVVFEGFEYFRVTVAKQAILGLRYVVEVSDDSVLWKSGDPNTAIMSETISNLVVRDNSALEAKRVRFIRLKVIYES